MKFPTITGSNLQRRKFVFPVDFSGRLNIAIIAFQQWQQTQVNTWIPLLEQIEEKYEGVVYYELPVIRRMNILGRTFINEGMRAGIPNKKSRERTVTFYTDKRAFKEALDIPDERNIYVLLVDANGEVLWRTEGILAPDKAEALEKAIQTAWDG